MVPSDTSVLECLLEATESRWHPLRWTGTPARRTSELNGIRLELFRMQSSRRNPLCLSLACEGYKVYIQQPARRWVQRHRPRGAEDQRLAHLFEALALAAGMPAEKPFLVRGA